MMIAAALAMPEIPLPVFCLMVGAAIGLGSILTPYATWALGNCNQNVERKTRLELATLTLARLCSTN